MARRLKKLIKAFRFIERNRPRITLDADTRLNPSTHCIQLKEDANGHYSTAADLAVRTWLAVPNTVKRWIGFQAYVRNKNDFAGTQKTDVQFRLSADGITDLIWDGAWLTAGVGDWNTEADIASNIATFPVTEQAIQVVVNLSTQLAVLTPEVDWVKLLYESDLEWQEDYVVRSLIPELRDQIRPIGEYALDLAAAAATIDLGAIETPYAIVGVDSAYNLTNDPKRLADIASAYDSGTKILTLTGSQALGEHVLVRFLYQPVVAFTTSQDYTELAKVPAIVVEDVGLFSTHRIEPGDHVINKSTGDGYQLTEGYHTDIEFQIRWVADKAKDEQRLADELKRFFANNKQLRSRGQDELFDLYVIDRYGQQTTPSQDELQSGRLRGRIVRAVFYAGDAKPVTGVKRFRATGGNVEFETP